MCSVGRPWNTRLGGPVVALNIPIGQWHTVRALESGTVIMEVKDGADEPMGGYLEVMKSGDLTI